MAEGTVIDQTPSERLARVQETLRALLARSTDPSDVEALNAGIQEIGLVRLGLDTPTPESRRSHMRVAETIGTALQVDGREVDAAIIDISVGGVGLLTDEPLAAGTLISVAVPPVGWIDAEVMAAGDGRLHVRFVSGTASGPQQRALLDLVLRHYE